MEVSELFLTQHANRHFVSLRVVFVRNADEQLQEFASGFVVEIAGKWVFITAAHVLDFMESRLRDGWECECLFLHDEATGHGYKGGVALPKDTNWHRLQSSEHGFDYAATEIPSLMRAALEKGKIRAIDEVAWRYEPPQECDTWGVVGIPAETHRVIGSTLHARLIFIPMEKADAPEGEEGNPYLFFGRLARSDDPLHPDVANIAGMSGGPVFGFKTVNGTLRYWAIGVQSGWRSTARIANFCMLPAFLQALETVFSTASWSAPDELGN